MGRNGCKYGVQDRRDNARLLYHINLLFSLSPMNERERGGGGGRGGLNGLVLTLRTSSN